MIISFLHQLFECLNLGVVQGVVIALLIPKKLLIALGCDCLLENERFESFPSRNERFEAEEKKNSAL